jgi:hypothetical protein
MHQKWVIDEWALGAQRSDVVMPVLKRAALLLALGFLSGLAAWWFATRAIQAFLFGVGRHDPIPSWYGGGIKSTRATGKKELPAS